MSTNGDAPPADEIVERLLATDTLPDELRGVQRRTQAYGGGRKESRFEIWERPPVELRLEVLSAETVREPDFEVEVPYGPMGKSDGRADAVIQNESGLAEYDRETNRYYKHDFEPPEDAGGYVAEPALVGSSPRANFDVTYDGTDTIVGRETHVLTFRPEEDADRFYRAFDHVTMWIDGKYWLPLEHEVAYELRDGGLLQPDTDEDLQDETYFQTETFEEIEFDIGLEDSRFHPPEDAERVE